MTIVRLRRQFMRLPPMPAIARLAEVPIPFSLRLNLRCLVAAVPLLLLAAAAGCNRLSFPDVPAGYREFAYVSNGSSNTVSILDLVYLRQDRTLRVGASPSGMAANPVRDEVYVVNTQSGSVSIIDAEKNAVVATIPVGQLPYTISVEPSGHRAYVANAGSNNVSMIDLDRRQVIAVAGTGEAPGLARIAPDMRSLVVTNRGSGSVSVFEVAAPGADGRPLRLRATFTGCPGATDAAILPDSSKAFVACSNGHQVMSIGLAMDPSSWAAKHDPSLVTDRLMTMLDVGMTPVQLAMKPDGGEIFVSNYASDSISEIATGTDEVGGTYLIGKKPVHGIVSRDNGRLWVSNFGADSIEIYSIDDGKREGSIHTGSAPDALAFSADEHLLLATDAHSGDVAVIRTQSTSAQGAALFTILPAGGSPNSIVVKAMQGKR
jgi:YVTN family beta-propeller protein